MSESEELNRFVAQARALVSDLESGREIDRTTLAQGMGSTLEYMLCGLFSADEATRAYWVDGVVLNTPVFLPDSGVVATGYAWCADHRSQWQVPAQIQFSLSDGFLKIRIGDAKHATLDGHRTNRPADTPREWLMEFDVRLA